MSDLVRTTIYDQLEDKVINRVTYDNTAILEQNARDRADRQGFGKYKGTLVHAGRLHMGDIERLKNMGYNLLSSDPEEVRRALLYIQSNEWKLLSVEGTPFAKQRVKWQ
jgi:hypothetical protein